MVPERDPSRFIEPLPPRPSLEMQQKRAKDLLRAAWANDESALARIRALHPSPPAAEELKLADAQLVIARGYAFENWAAMKRTIESLTQSPVERFLAALHAQDIEHVRELPVRHPEVRAAINDPISYFDSRPIARATKNLALFDLLVAHGADPNVKSAWWAGGFGLLEYDLTPSEAAPLIDRGVTVDVFAAAHLGMFDRVRELIDANPDLVHARGGDGKTPLHNASTVAIARYLIERGARLDVRCVDHESTPAQYLMRDAPDVVRLLVDRGAWLDIFIAVGLRDAALVERCLRDDPDALRHRTWQGKYVVAHNGKRAATPEEIGDRRGDIYRWVFGHNVSAVDAARRLGFSDMVDLLLRRAPPVERLLAACSAADREAAMAIVVSQPDLVRTLTPGQMRLIADKAHAGDTEAVTLMIDLGFDLRVRGVDNAEPLRWAAFLGNATLVERLLHRDSSLLGVADPVYGGTPLNWCVHGSLHGWTTGTGDFARCIQLLLDAGEHPEPTILPTGRDDVDRVLRRYFASRASSPDVPT